MYSLTLAHRGLSRPVTSGRVLRLRKTIVKGKCTKGGSSSRRSTTGRSGPACTQGRRGTGLERLPRARRPPSDSSRSAGVVRRSTVSRMSDAVDAEKDTATEELPFGVAELCSAVAGAGRVLDLGCGSGRLTVALALAGAAVTGLDTSRERPL